MAEREHCVLHRTKVKFCEMRAMFLLNTYIFVCKTLKIKYLETIWRGGTCIAEFLPEKGWVAAPISFEIGISDVTEIAGIIT